MRETKLSSSAFHRRSCGCSTLLLFALQAAMVSAHAHSLMAQQSSPPPASEQQPDAVLAMKGKVVDREGKPASGVQVRLEPSTAGSVVTITDTSGAFLFKGLHAGHYAVHAERSGMVTDTAAVDLPRAGAPEITLVLGAAGSKTPKPAAATASGNQAMEFSDEPKFTVAGVTDWTAVGGHGSDATLRTSEDLARATSTLKEKGAGPGNAQSRNAEASAQEARLRAALAAAPAGYAANRDLGEYYLHTARYKQAVPLLEAASAINPGNATDEYDLALACRGAGDIQQARRHVESALAKQDNPDWHRLEGELDEQLGDPLAAVHQEQLAAHLDPSEENYFAWGSELLLHRAVWQAGEVFRAGVNAHPTSVRMLTALGTALFAGALYDEAAQRLCEASDLAPSVPEPYLFMGRIAQAAPSPLACVDEKLAHFAQQQPGNASANYFYAMSLLKKDTPEVHLVERLLQKAVSLDPKYSDAYLQLGILAFTQHDYPKAMSLYAKAIEANPQLGEAHYRLGVAYDRTGDSIKAKQEFQLHDEIEKTQADAVEQQRREVKQFLVVLKDQPATGKPQ